MTIRKASLDDLPEITQLFEETVKVVNALDYTFDEITVWANSSKNTNAWQKHIREQYFIVAEQRNKIVGFSSITPSGYLDFMYVHKNHQGKGIASSLLSEIEKKAGKQKNELIWSSVSKTAKPFFEKKGYSFKEEIYNTVGEITFTNSRMEKRLTVWG